MSTAVAAAEVGAQAVPAPSVEQRAAAVRWLMPYVLLYRTAVEQDEWLRRIAWRLDVDLDALRLDLSARLPRSRWSPGARLLVEAALRAVRTGIPATATYCLEDALAEMAAGERG